MRGSSWLVIVPAFVALAAWLAWPTAPSLPPVDPSAVAAAAPASATADVDVAPVAVTPAAGAEAAAAGREAAPPTEPASASSARPILEVRIVDGATGAPAVGATAHWLPWSRLTLRQSAPQAERDLLHYDPAALAARSGVALRSDVDGTVRVEVEPNGGALFASAGGAYGALALSSEEPAPAGGWRLRLEPDRALRLRVVDAHGVGRPGVPVEVRAFDADGNRAQPLYLPPLPSGEGGLLTLPHCQAWLHPYGRTVSPAARWSVAALVPGHDDPGVDFAPQAPPSEPIELRLPAAGTIEVCVFHQGQRLTQDVDVQVWRGAASDTANGFARVPVGADGVVRVGAVALGGELVVRANVGSGAASLTKTVTAPRGDGEVVRVDFTTERLYTLHGTLVGPDGQPLADCTAPVDFDLQVSRGGGLVQTDARGRFIWFVAEGYVDRAQLRKLVFSLVLPGESPLRASILPRELQRGVTDLGVIRLDRGPLVVQGRIDADGAPPRGDWWVQVERLGDRRNRDGSERWERVDGLTRGRFDDGRFEFRGETTAARHRLSVPGNDHLPVAPVEFAVGATNVVVPVRVGHAVSAQLLLPAAMAAQAIQGVLRPRFEPPAEFAGEVDLLTNDRYTADGWSQQKGEARVAWSGLPAGTYDLELRVMASPTPLLVVGDVVLPAPDGGDPRLRAIDLRDAVRLVRFDVTFVGATSGSEPLDDILVFSQPQPDPQRWRGDVVRADAGVPMPAAAAELLVCSSGHEPRRVTLPAGRGGGEERVAVELARWQTTELVFEGLAELPEGIELVVNVREGARGPSQGARFRTAHRSGPLEPLLLPTGRSGNVLGGKAQVTLGAGSHALAVYLTARRSQASSTVQLGSGATALPATAPRSVPLRSAQPAQLVAPSPGPIVVRVDPAEVAAALATLQGGR